jgi:hypothetical protein
MAILQGRVSFLQVNPMRCPGRLGVEFEQMPRLSHAPPVMRVSLWACMAVAATHGRDS